MFFSQRLPLGSVIALCRAMRHSLGAGITLVQAFRQQAERGQRGVRPLAQRILVRLEQGDGLVDALQGEKNVVPPLLLALVEVGEETGHLAEVFAQLEKYYTLQDSLRKQFRSQCMLPVIQFCLALFIIAGLIFVLGMIAAPGGNQPQAVFGLRGALGALRFLVTSFGSIGLLWLSFLLLAHGPAEWPCRRRSLAGADHRSVHRGICHGALLHGRLPDIREWHAHCPRTCSSA